jgi:5-methylcytosine-specific restriction protein A
MIKKPKTLKPYWVNTKPGFSGTNKKPEGFYQSKQWKQARELALNRDYHLCVMCKANGVTRIATHVDHIKPIRLGGDKLSLTNLQSLCKWCHNAKSGTETRKNPTGGPKRF